MKQFLESYTGILMILICSLTVWIVSTTSPLSSRHKPAQAQRDSVTVFLLERDLPKTFKRIGIVSITPTLHTASALDHQVKQQLKAACQKNGANGAFRINEGTYPPYRINYLLISYEYR